jgi:hypothetical protein
MTVGMKQKFLVGHKFSTLTKINPLPYAEEDVEDEMDEEDSDEDSTS